MHYHFGMELSHQVFLLLLFFQSGFLMTVLSAEFVHFQIHSVCVFVIRHPDVVL